MSVKTRIWIERQFVTLVVRVLLASGSRLSLDRSEEGGSHRQPVADASTATIDEVMACDIETLFVDDNAWVQLVYGNDGWDVVSDYHIRLDTLLAPILKLGADEDMEALVAALRDSEKEGGAA